MCKKLKIVLFRFKLSTLVAWRSGSERRFSDCRDCEVDGSTPFKPHDKNLSRSKLKKSEAKLKRKIRKQGQFQNKNGFVL